MPPDGVTINQGLAPHVADPATVILTLKYIDALRNTGPRTQVLLSDNPRTGQLQGDKSMSKLRFFHAVATR
jgi:hypothetical protein